MFETICHVSAIAEIIAQTILLVLLIARFVELRKRDKRMLDDAIKEEERK